MVQKKLGIYCSHDEKTNGPFDEAVRISNEKEYLVWLEKSPIKIEKFPPGSAIVIKIKGEDRFYRGKLKAIKRAIEIDDKDEFLKEKEFRPSDWVEIDRDIYGNFQSVLYIQNLKEIPEPIEIVDVHPPQRPIYIEFES